MGNAQEALNLLDSWGLTGKDYIDIVFDGPPGPVSGRFVEVEDPDGASISIGEWVQREDGYWVLRIGYPRYGLVNRIDRLADDAHRRQRWLHRLLWWNTLHKGGHCSACWVAVYDRLIGDPHG